MKNKSNKLPCIRIRCGQKETELSFYYGYITELGFHCKYSTELSLRMEGPFGLDFFRPTLRTLNQQLRDNKDIYSVVTSEEYGSPTITYCTDNLSLFTYYSQIIDSLSFFISEHYAVPEYLLLCRLGKYRSFCAHNRDLFYWYDDASREITPLEYLAYLGCYPAPKELLRSRYQIAVRAQEEPERSYLRRIRRETRLHKDDLKAMLDACKSEGCPTPKELRRLLYQIAVRAQEEPERSYIRRIRLEMRLHKDNLEAMLDACYPVLAKLQRSIFHSYVRKMHKIKNKKERNNSISEPLQVNVIDAAKARGLPASFYDSL